MVIPYRSKFYFVCRDFFDCLVATFYLCAGNLDGQSMYVINLGGVSSSMVFSDFVSMFLSVDV